VCIEGDGHRAGDAGDLFQRDDQVCVVAPSASQRLWKGQAQDALLAHAPKEWVGKTVVLVDLLGMRGDLLFREIAHHAAQHVLLVAPIEVHRSSCRSV